MIHPSAKAINSTIVNHMRKHVGKVSKSLQKSNAFNNEKFTMYSIGKLKEIVYHVPSDCVNSVEFMREFENVLVESFGGFTVYETIGAWRDDTGQVVREPMARYIIAVNSNIPKSILTLLNEWIKESLNQQCVYSRHPNGMVNIG